MCTCLFEHEAVASLLLERAIALDAELGKHVDGSVGRLDFIKHLIEDRSLTFMHATPAGPWQAFVMEQVMRAVHDGDLTAFVGGLQRELWLLGDACVGFQTGLIDGPHCAIAEISSSPFSTSIPHFCGASRRRDRKPSSTHSPTRTYTSFRYSPASGRCRTICRTRQAWGPSRG